MSFFWKSARALAHVGCAVSLLCLLGSSAGAQPVAATGGRLSNAARATFAIQFKAFQAEKAALTPAQRKLSTPLAMAIPAKRSRVSANFKAFQGFAAAAADGRSDVLITGKITPAVLSAITRFRGTVITYVPGGSTVRALLSPAGAEQVAMLDEVRFISLFQAPKTNVGPKTSQGDITHVAGPSRELFKVTGDGIRIGVISDGVTTLNASVSRGELPANVTVIKNGRGRSQKGTGDEGTAMLEIVHDIAPGAQLYFASGYGSKEEFADNIKRLRAAGCHIIVDDLLYFDEGVYQDDIVAQAVSEVVKDGALYFSSAANTGNLTSNASGTWEGQFRGGETLSTTKGIARLHLWNGEESNLVTEADAYAGGAPTVLHWADPLGASTNDYDLYVLDSAGQIVSASQDVQSVTGAPYEVARTYTGDRVVVVLVSGQPRPLHLGLITGTLAQGTSGATYGHMASKDAIGVAAVPAMTFYKPVPVPFTRWDEVEYFSADGYRTFYFDANGKKSTYTVRTPQIAAVDGVSTSVPGFTSFYGTSAAAPHAAAIAALIWSYDRKQSNKDVKEVLYKSTLDIMGSGFDRDSGNGIVMVDLAMAKIGPPVMSLLSTNIKVTEGNSGVKNLKVTLQLSKKSDTDLKVDFATKAGTAKADADFVSKNGILTIPKGATKVDVYFDVKNDKDFEADETFTVNFSKGTVPFKGSKAVTVTIVNDDTSPAAPTQSSQKTS
jgi:hypothetical protein